VHGSGCQASSISGGTGVVSPGRGGALPASAAEQRSDAGAASQGRRLESSLELAALPTAPGCARGHVRSVVREWGLGPELATIAELVTSELVTNAVQACDGSGFGAADLPVVRLWLVSDRVSLVIQVWDASKDTPIRQPVTPDQERGWGLMLVDNLAEDWGVNPEENGKVVWVLLR
jgi:anti-sigma regulatory factor (Ser/Thr protein kinase)